MVGDDTVVSEGAHGGAAPPGSATSVSAQRRRDSDSGTTDAGTLRTRPSVSSSLGQLSRNASPASLADVLNGNDEREHAALLRSALAAFLRGATVGGVLKGGVSLVSLLLAAVKSKHKRDSSRAKMAGEVRGALRYALFLGCYFSGFRVVESALERVKGSQRWRAAAAGVVVAPTFLLADTAPSASLSVYVALRAALLALRAAKQRKSGVFATPAGAALFQHGPVLSMCAAASVLLHGWLLEPTTLDKAYVSFLDRHGGKGRAVVDALSEMAMAGCTTSTMPAVREWYASNQQHACGALDAVPDACSHPCDIVHPGQGHLQHALWFALRGVPAGFPVYVPVYAVSTILVQRGNLLKQPTRVLTRASLGVLRSSAFLSSYCALAWLSCCSVHNATGCKNGRRKLSRATILLCSLPAGLATLIEKPSRRTELALFCSGHALQSAARCALHWGWVRPVRRADVVLLTLSSGFIMHTYRHEPTLFRSSFRNVFDWCLGHTWRRRGSFVSLIY